MNLKLGQTVRLTIIDHCQGSYPIDGPLTFNVYGEIIEVEKDYVTVAHWIATDGQLNEDTEVIVVLKAAIKGIKILK